MNKICVYCQETKDLSNFKIAKGKINKAGTRKIYRSNKCYACVYQDKFKIPQEKVIVIETERKCNSCEKIKPINDFPINPGSIKKDGTKTIFRLRYCKNCKGKKTRESARAQGLKERPELSFNAWRKLKSVQHAWGQYVPRTRATAKKRNIIFKLSPKYVRNLYEAANGKCPLTGWDLLIPGTTGGVVQRNVATLDRINPALGYIEGNVRLIAYQANVARNFWNDNELLDFCKAVVATNNPNCLTTSNNDQDAIHVSYLHKT